MFQIDSQILSRNSKGVGNQATYKAGGTSLEYIQLLNYSDYLLSVQMEGMGTFQFPARWKEEYYCNENFTGNIYVTPIPYHIVTPVNPFDYNPLSQKNALLTVNGFGEGEITVPRAVPLPPIDTSMKINNANPTWNAASNPTFFTQLITGMCPILDKIDLTAIDTTAAGIQMSFVISFTKRTVATTFDYEYFYNSTSTSINLPIIDHWDFRDYAIVSDAGTQISVAVTFSASGGSHNNSLNMWYHYEYPY